MTLSFPDVKLFRPQRFVDDRGWFVESWNRKSLDVPFCQDNQSLSREVGTVRGLHFQTPPHAQSKLVIVLQGRILDVVVDLRKASATYGKCMAVELSAREGEQLFVPKGFAHGFCTLEPMTLVMYKVDAFYAPASDSGIYWADEDLAIRWPVGVEAAHVSPKDRELPRLRDTVSPF